MRIKIRLLLMKEVDRRNSERIEAYSKARKPTGNRRKKKPMRNRAKPKERLE